MCRGSEMLPAIIWAIVNTVGVRPPLILTYVTTLSHTKTHLVICQHYSSADGFSQPLNAFHLRCSWPALIPLLRMLKAPWSKVMAQTHEKQTSSFCIHAFMMLYTSATLYFRCKGRACQMTAHCHLTVALQDLRYITCDYYLKYAAYKVFWAKSKLTSCKMNILLTGTCKNINAIHIQLCEWNSLKLV